MDRILITGATGFVGRRLVEALRREGHSLVLAGRGNPPHAADNGVRSVTVGDIGPSTDWSEALGDCSVVIHLAGQTPARGIPDEAYSRINDQGTRRLAEQTSAAGVRLFVFMSSLHAVTAGSSEGTITDRTEARPSSAYGASKLAAEGHVERLDEAGITAISLRPPLVIGAEASGNWRLIQNLAASPLPLPVGALHKPRSIISVDSLVDAVVSVIGADGPGRSGRFLVADPDPVSTADMVRLLRRGMGIAPRIFHLPEPMLTAGLAAVGRKALARSLFGHMEVDASRFRQTFGWSPRLSTTDGIVKSGWEFLALSKR